MSQPRRSPAMTPRGVIAARQTRNADQLASLPRSIPVCVDGCRAALVASPCQDRATCHAPAAPQGDQKAKSPSTALIGLRRRPIMTNRLMPRWAASPVMPTKVGIHDYWCGTQERRGWRAFARHDGMGVVRATPDAVIVGRRLRVARPSAMPAPITRLRFMGRDAQLLPAWRTGRPVVSLSAPHRGRIARFSWPHEAAEGGVPTRSPSPSCASRP